MANADSLFNQLLTGGVGAGVSGLFDIGSALLANETNRRSQDRQNSFNAEQAQLNREFQSQEAQIARDWQEEQYQKYSSPSAMVNQYKDAGLNPALMYGANLQSSTGSSPSPSGSTASGSPLQSHVANMTGIMSDFLGLAQLKQEISESKSREAANYASAGLSRSSVDVNNQSISESRARVGKLLQETRSEELKQGLIAAQQVLAETQSSLSKQQTINLTFEQFELEMRQKFMKDFKTLPSDNLFQSVWNLIFMGKNWLQELFK